MSEVDTRENLYADIDHWLGSWTALSVPLKTVEEAVHGWLDRQAAITRSEFWTLNLSLEEENGRLKYQIDELKARLEDVKARPDCDCCRWREQVAELSEERDSLEHDLSETEAEFAKEMAETLSLHGKQQAASHQAWVDAVDERDYWKQEVQYCMDAAYPPSHAPERPYNPHVMDYPPSGAYTTPSTLVGDIICGLRGEKAAEWTGVLKQLKETQAERDRYRELASELLDATHNMQLIADRGLA